MPVRVRLPARNLKDIMMDAKTLETLALELDQLSVIERGYAMQAYFVFLDAASLGGVSIGDFIKNIDRGKAAILLMAAPSKNLVCPICGKAYSDARSTNWGGMAYIHADDPEDVFCLKPWASYEYAQY